MRKVRPRAFFLFSMGNTRQGKGNGIGLASVNHFGGLVRVWGCS